MASGVKISKFDLIRGGKLLDCVLQSVLFILFFFITDKHGNYTVATLFMLARLQCASILIQALVKFKKKRVTQRFICLALLVLWQVAALLFISKIHKVEVFRVVKDIDIFSLPDALLLFAGVAIAFWYFVLSFKEAKYQLTLRKKK